MIDPIKAYNERLKLFSTFVNAIAPGLIGFAVLRPLIDDAGPLPLSSYLWGAVGVMFHIFPIYVLGQRRGDLK